MNNPILTLIRELEDPEPRDVLDMAKAIAEALFLLGADHEEVPGMWHPHSLDYYLRINPIYGELVLDVATDTDGERHIADAHRVTARYARMAAAA